MVWYSHLFKNFPQFVVIHIVKGFVVNKAETPVLWPPHSFQSQRKAMPKNVQTTAQLQSSQTLAKKCSKFSNQGFKQDMNQELAEVQTGFRKGRGTRDQIANIHWIREKAGEFQKNIHFCFIDYAKAYDCVDHNKLENS